MFNNSNIDIRLSSFSTGDNYPDSTQWATAGVGVSDPAAFSDTSSVMGSGNNSNRFSLNLSSVGITSPTGYMRQIMPHQQPPPQHSQHSQHSHSHPHFHSLSLSSSASAYGTTAAADEYTSLSLSDAFT
jgi:hypothetical protein